MTEGYEFPLFLEGPSFGSLLVIFGGFLLLFIIRFSDLGLIDSEIGFELSVVEK